MRKVILIFRTLLIVLVCFPLTVNAEQVLCMKKKMKVNSKGKVVFKRAYNLRDGVCKKKEIQVATLREEVDILSALLSVDGSGSNLDADLLDGKDSSSFAAASQLSSLSSNVSSINSDLGAAEAEILSLSSGNKIVRVGTENAEYTTISDAINYVNSQNRDSSNRWVILIGPGKHSLSSQITVPSYTTLRGFGKNSSIISGSVTSDASPINSTAGLVVMGSSTALEDLQVENLGDEDNAFGVIAPDLESTAEADETNFGVRLDRVIIKTRGSAVRSYGVYNQGSHLLIRDTEVSSGNGTLSMALFMGSHSYAQATIINSTLFVSDDDSGCGLFCHGLKSSSNGAIKVRNSIIKSADIGVYIEKTSTVTIRSSEIDAASNGVIAEENCDVHTSNSTVEGGFTDSTGGTLSCVYVADNSGTALNADCS